MRLDKQTTELRRQLEKLELRRSAGQKSADARRQKVKELAGPLSGALNAATVLRESVKGKSEKSDESETTRGGPGRLFRGQHTRKKRRQVFVLDQWVEIETNSEGHTTTSLYPSNDILIKNGQKMWPPPELVYRRMHFVGGVPQEYQWTTTDPSIRASGGLGVQRMKIETWLELIEIEKAAGTGHLMPTGNLPRPEERGGCDCQVCSGNRSILDGWNEQGKP